MGTVQHTFLGLAALVSSTAVLPTWAQAQEPPPPNPLVICDYLVSVGAFRNFGQCVSGFRVGDAAFCQQLDPESLALIGYRNRGECVSSLRPEPHRQRTDR